MRLPVKPGRVTTHIPRQSTPYTSDNYPITKEVFQDEACTEPFDAASDFMEDGQTYYYKIVAGNQSGLDDDFTIEDVLPDGLQYVSSSFGTPTVSGQTITWTPVRIPAGGSREIVVAARFEIDDITADTLNNVVTSTNIERGAQNSANVRTTFRAGEGSDAEISYTKKVSSVAGGVGDPLTFTIEVKNNNPGASKYITVQDNWPGENVVPVSYTVSANGSCNEAVLVDDGGNTYPFDSTTPVPTGTVIDKIQFKGLYIPAGGMVRLTIRCTISNAFDQLVNTVQTGTGTGQTTTASPPAYGMSISKNAYAYTLAEGIGKQLTIQDLKNKDEVVCYQIIVKNLKNSPISGATVTDKLPTSLLLTEGMIEGVTGQVLIRQKNVVSVLPSTKDASNNYYTTNPFDLDAGESVTLYLFTKVTDDTIAAAKTNKNCVTNKAYASFNSVQTGDASANFYIYEDLVKNLAAVKEIMWIGNYDDDLKLLDTGLKNWKLGDGDDIKNIASIQKGNLVIYRIGAVNGTGRISTTGLGVDIPIYEVLDTLPEGMEFVGVLKSGYHDVSHNTASGYNQNLGDKLIRDGETAAWNNNVYPSGATGNIPYSADLTVHYDAATRTVHILINGGDINNPLNDVYTTDNKWYPYFFVVAKATETKPSYTNETEIKTNAEVILYNFKGSTRRTEGDFAYFKNQVTTYSVKMTPGITKSLLGHYYANDPNNLLQTAEIEPTESLRYQIEIKNQDNSNNYKASGAAEANAPTNSFIKDYTVTDTLPAEYTYHPGSTTFAINRTYNKETGERVILAGADLLHAEPDAYSGANFEPTVETLEDGRTKLTWTFDEYQYRLLNCYNLSGKTQYRPLGFMNILTYDVDRNPDLGSTYGSYTNMAAAQFGYEFSNVSTGSPTYASRSVSATNIVNVFGASGTKAVKSITNQANQTTTGSSAVNKVQISAGETVTYTLQVTNATATSQVGSLVLIDELPREANDTGVVNRVDRASEFSVLFTGNPQVTIYKVAGNTQTAIDQNQYTVFYGTSTGEGLRTQGDWTVGAGGYIDWQENASEGKNAIRIVFDSDFTIDKNESILISFDAKAADTLASGKNLVPGSIAWNSFGYAYRAIEELGDTSPVIHSEPQKVGAYLAGAKISVTKKVTGDNYPTDKPFTFLLAVNDAPQADVAYRVGDDPTLRYTDADGHFTINANETATLYMAPVDENGSVTEILADMPEDFIFVSAAGDGTEDEADPCRFVFGAAADESYKVVDFTNHYAAPTPAALDLKLTKTIQGGRLPESAQFAFTLQRTDEGAASDVEMPSADACKVSTSAMMEGTSELLRFGTITFKAAGFYSFLVSETATGIYGMTDAVPQTVYVLVTKETTEQGNVLHAAITDAEQNPIENGDALAFTNVYAPSKTKIAFPVKKTIATTAGKKLPQAAAFTFTLALTDGDAAGVTMPADTTVTTQAITNGSTATVSFGEIAFTAAGVYTFTIAEQASGLPTMTDAAGKTITVTVTDENGELSASCVPAIPTGGYEFINTYGMSRLTSAALHVTKQLVGEKLPAAQSFTFTLALKSGDETGVTMPANTTATTPAITEGAAAPVGFGDILFTKAGSYVFTITETPSGIPAMRDAPPQEITVEVAEVNGTFTPTITTAGGGGLVFTNIYPPAPATLQLGVQKTVSGDALAAAKAFAFTLKLVKGDSAHVILPEQRTITTGAITTGRAEAVYFEDMVFNAAGSYTFEISETATGIEGMKDAAPQTVTVTVTNKNGKLEAATEAEKTLFAFENTYTVPPEPSTPDDPAPTPPSRIPTPPPTGDGTNLWLPLALLLVSGAALLGVWLWTKRKKK